VLVTYQCHNRAEYRELLIAQDGYYIDGTTRVPKLVSVPFALSRDCQYRLSDLGRADKGCDGCRWRDAK
jgi:hypothetical protein